MQKYISKARAFSSSSKQKQSIITPQKSLSKLRQRLKSGQAPYGTTSFNERVKDEYMISKPNRFDKLKRQHPKTTYYKMRRKESLDIINRDLKFENQLKDEINNLNITFFECLNLQKQLISHEKPEKASQIVSNKHKKFPLIEECFFVPPNIKQLAHLQQKIQNRDKQLNSITEQIAQLKQDYWNLNKKKIPLKQKSLSLSNVDMDRFLLAGEVTELHSLLKDTIRLYKKKYNDLKAMKVTINNAQKDSEHFYQLRVKKSQKYKDLLLEKPVTYAQFKHNRQQKGRQAQTKNTQLNRVKSLQSILPSNINQFSNISNVSAILPMNFVDEWLNRQLLPGEIPSLPKQHHPTMKSMNLKRKMLKQATQTQKSKHEKQMTQMIDKLLFLHDQDTFLTEEVESRLQEINELEAKFSWIDVRTRQPTTISKKSSPPKKRKALEEESSIHFVEKNNMKNYIEQNLLLDNTGNQSSILDQTGKVLRFV